MNELTQNGAYHERAANGNLCLVILFKNFRCGLKIFTPIATTDNCNLFTHLEELLSLPFVCLMNAT
jgi:hypothetical protein